MKINLRKANAIQNEIKAALRDLSIETNVTVSEFEDATSVIAAARARSAQGADMWTSLTAALFEIRKKTAHANVASGISDALADIAAIDDRIAMLRGPAAASSVQMEEQVLAGRIAKIKDAPRDAGMHRYGGMADETVTTGIFTSDEVDAFAAEISTLKRGKRDLQDSLLGLNVSTEIEMSDEAVTALKGAGII